MLGLSPLMGLLVVGPAGLLIDRIGARRIVIGVLCLSISANLVLAWSAEPWQAIEQARARSESPQMR